jgi:hypothetical protein
MKRKCLGCKIIMELDSHHLSQLYCSDKCKHKKRKKWQKEYYKKHRLDNKE